MVLNPHMYNKFPIEQKIPAALPRGFFILKRQGKGSHQIWCKGTVFVPVPFNLYSRNMANAILKQAGIGERI
jgi:hypothetical protein